MDLTKIKLIAPYKVEGIENATIKEAYSYLRHCKVVTIDTETATHPLYKNSGGSGLDPYSSILISLQIGDDKTQYVIDLRYSSLGLIEKILTNEKVTKIGVNLKFDYKIILHHLGVKLNNIYDIGLAELVCNCGLGTSWSLKALALKYLGLDLNSPQGELFESYVSKETVKEYENLEYNNLTLDLIKYSAADIIIPFLVYPKILKEVRDRKLSKTVKLENAFSPIAATWELKGFKLDHTKWLDVLANNKSRLADINYILNTYLINNNLEQFIGTNWNSSKQVIEIFKALGIDTKVVDKEKSIGGTKIYKDSVGKLHIKKLASNFDIIDLYLEYKQLYKYVTTYGFKFLANVNPISERIHTNVYQVLNTGRISTSDVNLQNIPATDEFRACFVAGPDKKLIIADYSSQESRVLAEFAKEQIMLKFFRENGDMHSYTAEKIFGVVTKQTRQMAKIINFAIVYGASEFKLANDFQLSVKEVKAWIDAFFNTYPGLKPYFDREVKLALNRGYILINNVFNRRSYLPNFERYTTLKNFINHCKANYPDYKIPSKIWSEFFRMEGSYTRNAQNYRIQGSSGEMTKYAAILVSNAIKAKGWEDRAYIVNLVHDEIVLECDEKIAASVAKILEKSMLKAGMMLVKSIPMTCSVTIADFWKK